MTPRTDPETAAPTAAPEDGADPSPTATPGTGTGKDPEALPGPGAAGRTPAAPNRRPFAGLPWYGLITSGLAQAVLLFWWAALRPGLYTPDSLDYISQATTGHWNTHHPIAYTTLVWLSLQLTGGVAALTLAQTVAMAAGLAYAVTGLRRLGGPGWLWATAAVAVVALPPVGSFLVCVWKDVAFVICHGFLLGTLARLVAHRRAGREPAFPRTLLVATLVELTLICLFRQNGFVGVAITVGLCALLLRRLAVRLIAAGVAAASVALLTNWLLLPALGVPRSDSIVAFESFYSDIAVAYADDPRTFSATDTGVLALAAPPAHWRESANCLTVDPTVHDPKFDRQAAATHKNELLTVWWHTARHSPGTVLRARICRGSIAWRTTSTGGLSRNPSQWSQGVYLGRDAGLQQSRFRDALHPHPVSQRANRLAWKFVGDTSRPEFDWLLWRGATWSYVAYLVVGLAAWRLRSPAVLVLASVTVGAQTSVFLLNAAQAARYMAVPFVLGVLLLPLLAAGRPGEPTRGPAPPVPGAGSPPARPGSRAGEAVAKGQARLDERG